MKTAQILKAFSVHYFYSMLKTSQIQLSTLLNEEKSFQGQNEC